MENILIKGDALTPALNDLIAQTINKPIAIIPRGAGWSVIDGNSHSNFWVRVVYRYDAEEGAEQEEA